MPDDKSNPSPSVIAESKTQQYGYVRVYRAVMHECGIHAAYLYGVLEDYAQMGARTHKGCVPSHKHLAELTGLGEKTVRRFLNDLRDKGWLSWRPTKQGGVNTYTLHSKETLYKNDRPPRSERPTPSVKITDNQEQENKTERTTPPLSPTGDYTKGFEMAWTEYPHGTNSSKRKAYEAWKKLTKEEQQAATDALPAFKASRRWREGFIPHASTYLNQRLWETMPTADVNGNGRVTAEELDADIAAIIARAQENQPA